MSHAFKVGGLGEIAIRCENINEMKSFYRDVIGLEVLSDGGGIVFFALGNGVAGHISVLALFDWRVGRADLHGLPEGPPLRGVRSSLHHIALSLSRAEQEKALAFYEEQGIAHRIEMFGWIGWRGVFTQDPEGNSVELVAFDAEWKGKG